jgi:penicillin G amidase
MKWIWRLAAALVAMIVIAAAGGYVYLRASLPKTSGTTRVAGLAAPVDIVRDGYGIPHIYARSPDDAWFALGYVHAQDRLFQMEMMRRIGRGRLSEVIWARGLSSDRFMRVIGVEQEAEAALAALSPQDRDQLTAYAAGVNAFLASGPVLPPEFLVLRETPEPWRPEDSLIWDRLMAMQLAGNWRDELVRARLMPKLSDDFIAELWPNRPPDAATTLTRMAADYQALPLDRLMAALPPPLGPDRASNEWVVSGEHTTTGKPLLANDPHLALTSPGTWYLVHIEAPGLTLTGATAPGVPALILGHNGRIAWGFTTTGADMNDLFIERVDPDDPARYLTPDGSQPFQMRTETIKVRDGADVTLAARATRHGPVISDIAPEIAGGQVLALSFPAVYRADTTAASMFAVDRAQNWDEFLAALSRWHAPMQNIVYADVDGNIGFMSPGLIPRRKAGDGWLPKPGWTGEFDWDGFAPFAELPRSFNPGAGRIVNANNRVVGDHYPVFITRDWAGSHRAQRINELLDAAAHEDVYTAQAMQADVISVFARQLHDHFREIVPRDESSKRALALLDAWDGNMRRDRPEPLIFNAWMRALVMAMLHDDDKYDLRNLLGQRATLVVDAFDGTSAFCRDRAGGCPTMISEALQSAMADLSARVSGDLAFWRWDSLHYAPFRHALFDQIPVVRDIVGFHVPTDGDFFTVNRAAPSLSDPLHPFADVHGAGYRAIYDMSNLEASRYIMAPGESGHPLSRHWGDMVGLWSKGRDIAISGDRAKIANAETLTLHPR